MSPVWLAFLGGIFLGAVLTVWVMSLLQIQREPPAPPREGPG